jgi:hypothetical protein
MQLQLLLTHYYTDVQSHMCLQDAPVDVGTTNTASDSMMIYTTKHDIICYYVGDFVHITRSECCTKAAPRSSYLMQIKVQASQNCGLWASSLDLVHNLFIIRHLQRGGGSDGTACSEGLSDEKTV